MDSPIGCPFHSSCFFPAELYTNALRPAPSAQRLAASSILVRSDSTVGMELPRNDDVNLPEKSLPRSYYLDADGRSKTGLSLEEINRVIVDRHCRVWVDIDSSKPDQADVLKRMKGLHPLAVEDALATNARPKT